MLVDEVDGPVVKDLAIAARFLHAVLDVQRDFGGLERLQVIERRDALHELAKFRGGQRIAQLRLPDKHKLHDDIFVGIDVGDHPQLFEGLRRHVLGFVHNHQHTAPGGVFRNDEVHKLVV